MGWKDFTHKVNLAVAKSAVGKWFQLDGSGAVSSAPRFDATDRPPGCRDRACD